MNTAISTLVPPESGESGLISIDEAVELLDIGYKDSGKLLIGGSRNNWFAWTMQKLADAHKIKSLDFLYCNLWATPQLCCGFLFKQEFLRNWRVPSSRCGSVRRLVESQS
jgi:hypothetical protein